ncbi:amino acid ABC transporter permease [Rhodoferax sp.]|uniref:amino acid ABC transporter permease n=1 Tax=Rhodoferax sp. TaxID=50421 RepID=UPI00351D1A5A
MREFTITEFWYLLQAARWTIVLSVVAFFGGSVVGFVIALMRVAKSRLLKIAAIAYIKIFQGTPLLMQLYLIYFGLNMVGLQVEPWTAAALAFTLYASAFLGEIWRGCIQIIPRGQWEGARSLALSYSQQLRFIVLPQALRIGVPPTVGFLVQLVKGTSLASIIGFVELTRAAQVVNNSTFSPLTVYAIVALIYFCLCWPLSRLADRLERRLGQHQVPKVLGQI